MLPQGSAAMDSSALIHPENLMTGLSGKSLI